MTETPTTEQEPWALVTGAGSGIGAALAAVLTERGYRVVLVGRRAARLEATRSAFPVPEAGICCAADLARSSDRAALIQRVNDVVSVEGGHLRYLVHNAGIGAPSAGFEAMAPDALEEAMAVNMTAPLTLTQGWLPLLRAAGGHARLLLVGAGIAERAQPGTGIYGITKCALHRLFDQMVTDFSHEREPSNPAVALFRPGLVDTEGLRDHIEAARACGLPHVDYLEQALAAGDAWTARDVAHAMSNALVNAPAADFHSKVLRTAEWQGA